MIVLLYHFLYCVLATGFFALMMSAPKKSVPFSALCAGIGYVIYEYLFLFYGQELWGYFVGTLFIALSGEALARILKMPSIMFIFPAIIPLVPGLGIYRTMLTLVENRPQDFMAEGSKTLFIAGAMALAIAITSLLARKFKKRPKKG